MRLALVLVALFACKSKSDEAQPRRVGPPAVKTDQVTSGSGDMGIVQPRFSGGQAAPTDEGSLGFTVTKVHANRKPSAAAPFHEAGGTWSYFEAHIDGDPAATFVVGMPAFAPAKGMPGFGDTMFAPTTKAAGAKVIEHLAKALRVTAPAATPGGVLQAMKVPVAVLGVGIGRLDNGLGGSGSWTATKIFCSNGDVEAAELFFNVSLADKRGEFSEKDTDYNKDVVACLASVLRDGLPPPRTPENDPTLAAKGPHLELGKRIGGRRMERLAFTAKRTLMLEERGTESAIVEIDLKTGAAKELYKTPDRLEHGYCDQTVTKCLIKGSKPSGDRNTYGGDDVDQLVFLDGAKASMLDTSSFATSPNTTRAPISPDGRFIVVQQHDYKTGTKLFAIDRQSKQMTSIASTTKGSFDVVDWVKDGGKWIAVVSDAPYEESEPAKVLDWHVEDKGITKPSKRAVPDEHSPVSPDGKRRGELKDGTLTITDGGKQRTLKLHPADARHFSCCEWIDSRYLDMRGGFIDTDAMKVSLLPKDPEDDDPRVEYMRGTRNALVFKKDGVYLATLVGP